MLLTDAELKLLTSDDRRAYENAAPEVKQQLAARLREAWAEGTDGTEESSKSFTFDIGLWLMIGGVVFILIGFFYDVGVGSEFDRVVNLGKMGEKFAFLFIGLGTLITGSIFWNADRIVKATETR